MGYNFITFYNHNHQQYGSRKNIVGWTKIMTLWRRDVVISQRNDGSSPNGFSQIFYGAEKQDMNGDDSLSEETYFQVSDGIQWHSVQGLHRDCIPSTGRNCGVNCLRCPCFSQWCGFWTRDSIGTWYLLWGYWWVDNRKACQFSCEFCRLWGLNPLSL